MKVTVGDVTNNKCDVREYLTCDEDGTIFVDLDALDTVLIDKSNEWDNLQRELADIKSMMPKDKHTLIKNIIGLNSKVQELENENDILIQSLADVTGASGFMIKQVEEQNQRYREAFRQIKLQILLEGAIESYRENIIEIIDEALEGEE